MKPIDKWPDLSYWYATREDQTYAAYGHRLGRIINR